MIENEVNHDDDDGRQFSMDLSTHSRFAMAFDLKVPQPPSVSPSSFDSARHKFSRIFIPAHDTLQP